MATEALERHGRAQQQAAAASSALDSLEPLFVELEAEYMRRWRSSKPAEHAEREDAWIMVRALEELRNALSARAKGGQVSAFNLRRHLAMNATRG